MSAPVNIVSRVRAVLVYRRGAIVTREAQLERAGAGFPARVQLVDLPLALDDSTVRVEVGGAEGRAGPIAGDLRVTVSVPQQDASLPPPTNEELDRARLDHELATEARDQILRVKARLDALQPVARGRPEEGKPPAPSPTAARLELLSFRRERSGALDVQLVAANERVRLTHEALETLRERERVASSQRNTRSYELRKAAIIELDGEGPGPLAERATIKLHYFVPGARWAPAYTVRLEQGMRAATLELRAMVGQATGEDWSDVALTLSTASPQQWTELPELESRRIGRRQPPPAKTGWRPPPVGAAELYADYDRGLDEAPAPSPAPAKDTSAAVDVDGGHAALSLEDLLQGVESESEPRSRHGADRPASNSMTLTGGVPMPSASPVSGAIPPPGPPPAAQPKRARAQPSAAPQSPPMMVVQSRAAAPKSQGLGSLVGDAIDGIASAFGSPEGSAILEYGAGGGGPSAPPPEPELVAGRDLLDYGRLRLFGAETTRRGSLRRIDLRMQYQQHSVASVRMEVAVEQITEAVEWARLLDTESAPERHRWPTTEAGFDYAYVAEARVDLASTGAFHSLPIEQREAEAAPRYVSVPRETQDVFRIVSLRNPLAAPLLPGPADVYVDGKFALSSDLELTPIDGRIELGLGVEQAVKIARNVSFSEDSSGMFKRHLGLTHTIAVEVQNHLSSPAKVEVRERIPVAAEAQADDIEISVESVTPSWDDYEPKRPDGPELEGGRVWTVEVPAGGKRELEASWIVTIPANNELVGGNRRES